MEMQKQFSSEYLIKIKNKLYDPEYRKKYENPNFVAEEIEDNEDNVVKIPGLYNKRVNLIISDNPKDDFENARAFFEEYKNMSPIDASQEHIWAYLSHVEYFEYVKTRWKISSESSAESIIDHFFVTSMLKIARNGLARLWWPVYLTYDKDNKEPYHLTKIFFTNTQVVQSMSESQFFSIRPLTHGVLEFFEEHGINPTKASIDKIMHHFNALGGVRELAFEDKEFFKRTIETEIEL